MGAHIDLGPLLGALYGSKHPLSSYADDNADLSQTGYVNKLTGEPVDPDDALAVKSGSPYKEPGFWAKLLTPGIASQVGESNFNYQQRPLLAQQAEAIKTQQTVEDITKAMAAKEAAKGGFSGLSPEQLTDLGGSGTLGSLNNLEGQVIGTNRGLPATIANTDIENAQIARQLAETKNAGGYGLLAGNNALGDVKLANHANEVATKLLPNTDYNQALSIDAKSNILEQELKNRFLSNDTENKTADIQNQTINQRLKDIAPELLGNTAETYKRLLFNENPDLHSRIDSINPYTGEAVIAPPKLTSTQQQDENIKNMLIKQKIPGYIPATSQPTTINIMHPSSSSKGGTSSSAVPAKAEVHEGLKAQNDATPLLANTPQLKEVVPVIGFPDFHTDGKHIYFKDGTDQTDMLHETSPVVKAVERQLAPHAKQPVTFENSGLLGVVNNRLRERINNPKEMLHQIIGEPPKLLAKEEQAPLDPWINDIISTAIKATLFGDPNLR